MTPAGGEQKRAKRKPAENPEAEVEAPPKKEAKSTDDLDALIDEIDEVLEENAEEFVRSYVQKGGQIDRLRAYYLRRNINPGLRELIA